MSPLTKHAEYVNTANPSRAAKFRRLATAGRVWTHESASRAAHFREWPIQRRKYTPPPAGARSLAVTSQNVPAVYVVAIKVIPLHEKQRTERDSKSDSAKLPGAAFSCHLCLLNERLNVYSSHRQRENLRRASFSKKKKKTESPRSLGTQFQSFNLFSGYCEVHMIHFIASTI